MQLLSFGRILEAAGPFLFAKCKPNWGAKMDKFLESALLAWNPIGETRKRLAANTLTVSSVLVKAVGVVIACQLFAAGAHTFYLEALVKATGQELPQLQFLKNVYVQNVLTGLGVVVPIGAVSALPVQAFGMHGKNAVLAAMLIVAAAWSFYGAAFSVPGYVIAGIVTTTNLRAGAAAYSLFSLVAAILVVAITLFVWLRVAMSVMRLNIAQVVLLTAVPLFVAGCFAWFLVSIAGVSR